MGRDSEQRCFTCVSFCNNENIYDVRRRLKGEQLLLTIEIVRQWLLPINCSSDSKHNAYFGAKVDGILGLTGCWP